MKYAKYPFRACILLLSLLTAPASGFASDLVSVEWLQQHSKDEGLVVIDLRNAKEYDKGHISDAINLPHAVLKRAKNGIEGFVETPNEVRNLLESSGVRNEDTLVLYGDMSFIESMSVYWILDFYGHDKKYILDGGLQAWVAEDLPLSTDRVKPEPSKYVVEINPDIITTKFRTFMATKNSEYFIIDARDGDQFSGEKSLTNRKGRIPNASNLPWFELVNNREESDWFNRTENPSTLNNLAELRRKLGVIPKDKKIILYCNGGQESSVVYFALKELGIESAVYDGSWFEWSEDHKMPVVK